MSNLRDIFYLDTLLLASRNDFFIGVMIVASSGRVQFKYLSFSLNCRRIVFPHLLPSTHLHVIPQSFHLLYRMMAMGFPKANSNLLL
jgi:hypothetical protein